MNLFDPQVQALINEYCPYDGPDIRLHDLASIGYSVSVDGEKTIFASMPIIEESSYAQLIGDLLEGNTVTVTPEVIPRLMELFQPDQ